MAKQKKKVNTDAWLGVYSDMITLILVFFILLYSMSTIDQEKYRLLVKAFTADPETIEQIMLEEKEDGENIQGSTGGEPGTEAEEVIELDDLYKYLKEYVEDNNLQESVQVEKSKDLVYVKFMSNLFFEPDSAVLKPGGKTILNFVGKALSHVEPNVRYIRIDGHTAESSLQNNKINDRDLSTDRANEVLKFFENSYIRDPSKLLAVGYGKYRPIAPNDSEANRVQNRRVEILVAKGEITTQQIDEIYMRNAETTENGEAE